jgi:hypothetical protein
MNEVQSEIQKRKDKDKTSKEQKELHSKWTKEQEELLAEWSEKASCYRWLHGRAEKKFRCRNYTFTIPVIIMSTLTGTANFGMDTFVPEEHKKLAMATVGSVNIIAGIISTLQNFLRYAELTESHRSVGVSWSKLGRDIAVELALDPPRRKPAGDFLNVCRAEYDRLIEQSPLIDDSILKQFHDTFHDTDINKPEMCNGLDKCDIYKPSKEEKVADIVSNVAHKFSHSKKHLYTVNMDPFKDVTKREVIHTMDRGPTIDRGPKETKETKEHKEELSGILSMGKVSKLKEHKTRPSKINDELKRLFDVDVNNETQQPTTPIRDIEVGILKEDEVIDKESESRESEKTEESEELDELEPKLPETSEGSEGSELEKDTQDFLSGIIDEK